jgi:hypothetical protein
MLIGEAIGQTGERGLAVFLQSYLQAFDIVGVGSKFHKM